MDEFDELLNSVLREDANPLVPSGMVQRVFALLEQERNPRHSREAIWLGAAAVLVLGGVATWTLTRILVAVEPVRPAAAMLHTSNPASSPADGLQGLQLITSPSIRPAQIRLQLTGHSARAHSLSAQNVTDMAPISIDPIVIQPIEIAAVTQSISNAKGTP